MLTFLPIFLWTIIWRSLFSTTCSLLMQWLHFFVISSNSLGNKLLILQIVVFFSTCDAVDFHYSLLSEFQWPPNSPPEAECKLFLGCKTYRLHGNMNHEDRRTTFNAFKTEKSALLLSTDVSARGLDFPKVRCIIQYDSPGEATEYVHRFLMIFLEFVYCIHIHY